ncbi:hypothetical protein [Streptomyces sp. B3I8]|uniref:hypothetical protein n=1 Tax=Streptomyces sp. B3I8 TaxID=3042303 RepID=UPI0027891699|nr:hypothetical protein [Streptomyces sp. B3I8]MDQ0790029.1 hypothetical protein [Streptomyces sp. B3I8]
MIPPAFTAVAIAYTGTLAEAPDFPARGFAHDDIAFVAADAVARDRGRVLASGGCPSRARAA